MDDMTYNNGDNILMGNSFWITFVEVENQFDPCQLA
jgi:hypothetical protein